MKTIATALTFSLFVCCASAQLPNWLRDGRLGLSPDLLPDGKSFKIGRLMPNSPAERAGLKTGDILIAINDAPFQTPNKDSLSARLAGVIGSEITLTLEGGKRVKLVREALNVPASLGGPCKSGDCQNGEGVLHYPTPFKYGYYKGKFQHGLPQGEAVIYEDSTLAGVKLYEGAFSLGYYEGRGKGVFVLPEAKFGGTSAVYEGYWSQSQPAGQGKMTFKDGTVLTGDFRPDAVLFATFTLPDGRKFENGWATNYNEIVCLKKGTKQMVWYEIEAGTETPASTCVTGDCANGIGEYKWWDGTIYKGSFKNGFPHGKGKETKPDGTVHEGDFFQNYKHGNFTTFYNEGSVYTGGYLWNLRHGTGKLKYSTGPVFEGEYRDNEPNGYGIFTYKNGHVYEGNFVNGKKHGQGVLQRKDLERTFSGDFRNDQMHGIVEVTRPGGTVEVWKFDNDNPVRLVDLIWSQADWQRNQAERERESKMMEQKRKEQDALREATWKTSGKSYTPPLGKVSDALAQVALKTLLRLPDILNELESDGRSVASLQVGDFVSFGNTMTWININAENVVNLTSQCHEACRILHAWLEQKGACSNAVKLVSDSENLLSAGLDDARRRKDATKKLLGGPGPAAFEFKDASLSLIKRIVSASEKIIGLQAALECK
jgi:hypothetical protein